jgi:hypothetical protein
MRAVPPKLNLSCFLIIWAAMLVATLSGVGTIASLSFGLLLLPLYL